MCLLRRLACHLLVILLLPWGAYAHAGHAPAPAAPAGFAASEDGAAVLRPAPSRLVAERGRCRTAVLTGQGCGGDSVIAARPASPKPVTTTRQMQARAAWRLAGRAPVAEPRPPRSR